MPPNDWSVQEVAAIVADYLAMLAHELRGEAYSKRDHNRRLQSILNCRSAGAIEFKYANISAILIEFGFPYIDGYKPRANYQELLRLEVIARVERDSTIASAAQAIVDKPAFAIDQPIVLRDIFVKAPSSRRSLITYERNLSTAPPIRQLDYLEREARNTSLGNAGEKYVLAVEHRRLWEAGCRTLAERVEHVASTQGDGLGYDVLSYEEDGRERLIEVKTTAFGAMTPFFASANEVRTSQSRAEFHLYRVFRFRDAPRIFSLTGSLVETCALEPTQFRVRPY